MPSGGDASAARTLAQPLAGGRLRFAGEATCQRMYATVHGAYISAMREVASMVASGSGHGLGGGAAARLAVARRLWPMLSMSSLCEQTCSSAQCPLEEDDEEDDEEEDDR